LANLDSKMAHLTFDQREKLKNLVFSFKNIFPDVPNKTTAACHDVNINLTGCFKVSKEKE
jgi:hypothetical protein